ncbi:MAG: methyltransferase family protein [Novosphingobium sp.]
MTARTLRTSPLDNRIPPPLVTLITGAVMAGASYLVPPAPLPYPVRLGGLALVMVVGGVFGARAIAAFGRARTTINPVDIDAASTLVTTGIYGVSRNPMYVGLTSLLLALALGLGNAWLLLGPLGFALYITRFQILPEERAMAARFGETYAAYRSRVRRWL